MHVVTDLHLHSKYSRAVSPNMTLPVMQQHAIEKGLDILSTTDWTHPLWFKEIQRIVEEKYEGMYALKSQIQSSKSQKEVLFLLATEIASIYKQGDKLRRIHNLVFAPNLAVAEKISKELLKRGSNLSADGRPIIGLSSKQLLELILTIDETCLLIPCHVWTPHFGVYGSASGFDSLEECFGDLSKYVYGIETGLSSDPEMNWQIAELKNRSILSFSDAHSAPKMGREATVFVDKNGISNDKYQISNDGITYNDLRLAIMRKPGKLRIGYTIEFYPEEGKYHFSGHRNCGIVFGPEEIKEKGTICPVCKRNLTEGVVNRVSQLANTESIVEIKYNEQGLKWYTDKTKRHPPYVKLVPLLEIVAEATQSTVMSQKVKDTYGNLCHKFDSELTVILKTPIAQIASLFGESIAHAIEQVRRGGITIAPGYDGVYGKVTIATYQEAKKEVEEIPQLTLDI